MIRAVCAAVVQACGSTLMREGTLLPKAHCLLIVVITYIIEFITRIFIVLSLLVSFNFSFLD